MLDYSCSSVRRRAVVTAFQVETERQVDVPAHAEDALIGELRALPRRAESARREERHAGAGADVGDDGADPRVKS